MRALASALALAALACSTDTRAPSARCAGCHPRESAEWQRSDHARALALPAPDTVRAPFDGAEHAGAVPRRDGEAYVVELDGEVHRVTRVLGAARVQQFAVAIGGREQILPLGYDVEGQRWLRLEQDGVPWQSRAMSWNLMCAECHSTRVDRGYDPARDRYATTFTELTVGCEACHGPGAQHADDPRQPLTVRRDPEACAPCHARRTALVRAPLPSERWLDAYRPMTLEPGAYHPDGQPADEVFEYGAFAQSAMAQRGVRCVDCHAPHSGRTAPGNAVCLPCHGPRPPLDRFPTLAARAADLDRPEHHHHTPGRPGSACVDCHMPETTYLGADRRREHAFRIPRPDLSLALGVPNACTAACHADRPDQWAVDQLRAWSPRPPRPHFGPALARGAPHELEALATDAQQPEIVRATALERLFAHPDACLSAAARARHDPSAWVRSVALACSAHLDRAARRPHLVPALSDPARLVRLEAARLLAGDRVGPEAAAALARARAELDHSLELDLDRPEGWLDRALIAEAEGDLAAARAHVARAQALDPAHPAAAAHAARLARVRSRTPRP